MKVYLVMVDDYNNKRKQVIVFIICLIVLLFGFFSIATGHSRALLEWSGFWYGQWTTRSEPISVIILFAFVGLFYSGRNLLRLRRRSNHKD
jgi:RsiW-degrading membrane proteinase PrsW (M82 family)